MKLLEPIKVGNIEFKNRIMLDVYKRQVMFCSVVPRRGTQKSPKIVCGLRTPPVECSKLGKTQIIEDVRRGMVRNTGFCDQNAAAGCILELRIF